MKTAIDAVQGSGNQDRVGDIALKQFDPDGQVVAMAGGQIVQHPHPVATRDQRFAEVGADEARAAGDEVDRHATLPKGPSHDACTPCSA